jgi:hypothetical protein
MKPQSNARQTFNKLQLGFSEGSMCLPTAIFEHSLASRTSYAMERSQLDHRRLSAEVETDVE